ncbi:hypothetical protein F0U59_50600 [Archangium gephyra]|nr:hypothetical protein F0U59_50600 [Archangium gephyra]
MRREIGFEDVIRHMEVPGEQGIYVLGCFEKRVTVFSQQVRALNLLSALRETGKLPSGSSVAVIGGSVAGLTAAAAAARLGCTVTLLEKHETLLPILRGNKTRWLHPHIYDWPREGAEDDEAELPLLGWRAAPAGDVVRQLEGAWQALPEQARISTHLNVRSVELGQGRPRHVIWNAPGFNSKHFDVVILAIGFGLERKLENVPWFSYWDDNRLHQPSRNGPEHYLISGCGDGGLVDLLRVRLRDFRHESILQELLGAPSLEPLKSRLIQIDEEAARHPNPVGYLQEQYAGLPVPPEVDEVIGSRLRQDTSATLNGLEQTPLTLNACILNRFLVSRLLFRFGVSYRPGRFTHTPVANGRFEVRFSTGKPEVFDQIVSRHGPSPSALEEGFPHLWEKCGALRSRNELDQTRWPLWAPGSFGSEKGAEAPPKGSGAQSTAAASHGRSRRFAVLSSGLDLDEAPTERVSLYGPSVLARSLSKPMPMGSKKEPWQYHSRSDRHAKVACWGMLFDLLRVSKVLADQVRSGQVAFGMGHEMANAQSSQKKNLDVVICSPNRSLSRRPTESFRALPGRYGIVLSPEEQDSLDQLPDLPVVPVGEVRIAFEAKAAMTAHVKALPRLFDELSSSHATIHGCTEDAIAVGLVMVNIAEKFQSSSLPEPSNHRQPSDTERVIAKVRELPRSGPHGERGFDALAISVVSCANDGSPVELVTAPPAPQPGDADHYERMIRRTARLYEALYSDG